jgi:ATP-dependent Clp protease protease subunit
MNEEYKFENGLNLDSHVKLASKRIIFLSEDITKSSASQLASLLLFYDLQDKKAPIYLYINSLGGDASGLMSICDVMKMIKAPVYTFCLGKCYSAGAVILACGEKGHRYALKNSKIMIHGLQCLFPIPGFDVADSQKYYDFLNLSNDNVMKLLANKAKCSMATLKKECERDVWLDAQDALKYGLIDKIL